MIRRLQFITVRRKDWNYIQNFIFDLWVFMKKYINIKLWREEHTIILSVRVAAQGLCFTSQPSTPRKGRGQAKQSCCCRFCFLSHNFLNQLIHNELEENLLRKGYQNKKEPRTNAFPDNSSRSWIIQLSIICRFLD